MSTKASCHEPSGTPGTASDPGSSAALNRVLTGARGPFWALTLAAAAVLALINLAWHSDKPLAILNLSLQFDPGPPRHDRLLRANENSVALVSSEEFEAMQAQLDSWWLGAGRDQASQRLAALEQRVDARLEARFATLEENIDEFADWYYSSGKNYGLLYELVRAKLTGDNLDDYVAASIEENLFRPEEFEAELRADVAGLETDYARALQALSEDLLNQSRSQFAASAQRLIPAGFIPPEMSEAVEISPAWEELHGRLSAPDGEGVLPLEALLSRTLGHSLTAGLASGGTALVLTRAAARIITRTAASAAVGRGSAGVLSRAGAGAAGAQAGLLCGPLAPVCVPVAGAGAFAAAWVLSDAAFSRADEYLNRDSLVSELRGEMESLRHRTADEIKTRYREAWMSSSDAVYAAYSKAAAGGPAEFQPRLIVPARSL